MAVSGKDIDRLLTYREYERGITEYHSLHLGCYSSVGGSHTPMRKIM